MSVFDWMTQAKLNINPIKTEFLLIGCEFQRHSLSIFPLPILDNQTYQADLQRDWESYLKIYFFSPRYISSAYSACFYHIRDIRRNSKGLPLTLAERIAVALVTHNVMSKVRSGHIRYI